MSIRISRIVFTNTIFSQYVNLCCDWIKNKYLEIIKKTPRSFDIWFGVIKSLRRFFGAKKTTNDGSNETRRIFWIAQNNSLKYKIETAFNTHAPCSRGIIHQQYRHVDILESILEYCIFELLKEIATLEILEKQVKLLKLKKKKISFTRSTN